MSVDHAYIEKEKDLYVGLSLELTWVILHTPFCKAHQTSMHSTHVIAWHQ